jgi:hypothetical protein
MKMKSIARRCRFTASLAAAVVVAVLVALPTQAHSAAKGGGLLAGSVSSARR